MAIKITQDANGRVIVTDDRSEPEAPLPNIPEPTGPGPISFEIYLGPGVSVPLDKPFEGAQTISHVGQIVEVVKRPRTTAATTPLRFTWSTGSVPPYGKIIDAMRSHTPDPFAITFGRFKR
ncbi:MAG TPA: hypothetical protein VFB13_15180 [Reyranella sp.]|jgi:hypothetical protein|nr:hypothetical protein [Reyranella sp.]